jgi:secondary thiamine-phosphate synthase enzyme
VIRTTEHDVRTRGQGDVVDVTDAVQSAVSASGAREGLAMVFVSGSTAGVSAIEFEDGLIGDLDRALERLAPRHGDYEHHLRWHDDNGSSHVRAGIVGPSLAVPFRAGRLMTGTWQQIVLLEFDTRRCACTFTETHVVLIE